MIAGELMKFIASYAIILGMGWLIVNFLSNGFFNTFMIIKASRGKKILVKACGIDTSYFRAGKIDGKFLRVKDRAKANKLIPIEKGDVDRLLNVGYIEIDDSTNAVIKPKTKEVEPVDATKYDNLNIRALTGPRIENKNDQIIKILIIVALALAGFITFKVLNIESQLNTLQGACSAVNNII